MTVKVLVIGYQKLIRAEARIADVKDVLPIRPMGLASWLRLASTGSSYAIATGMLMVAVSRSAMSIAWGATILVLLVAAPLVSNAGGRRRRQRRNAR